MIDKKHKRKAIMTILDITLYEVTHKQILVIAYSAIAIIIVLAWIGQVAGHPLSNELLSLLFISYIASSFISEAGVSMITDGFRAAILLLIYAAVLSPFVLMFSRGLIFFLG